MVQRHGLHSGTSKVGGYYDNGCAESTSNTPKVEAIHEGIICTRVALQKTIFEYIEINYDRTRLHNSLGNLCPVEFELKDVV